MSAVTLETLRADFEAARLQFLEEYDWARRSKYLNFAVQPRESWWWAEQYNIWARDQIRAELGMADRVIAAARLYQVARAHGLQAAMLFKLSDGAIDPRGAA